MKFTTSFLIGSVIGATVVSFMSPISGRKRRQLIKEEIDETANDINEVTESLKKVERSLNQLALTANELVPTFKKDMEQAISDFKFQAEPRILEINRSLEKIESDFKN